MVVISSVRSAQPSRVFRLTGLVSFYFMLRMLQTIRQFMSAFSSAQTLRAFPLCLQLKCIPSYNSSLQYLTARDFCVFLST